MNHDTENPFKKLAQDFAERQKPASTQNVRREPASGKHRSPGKQSGKAPDPVDDSEEATLFLNAVSQIKPLAKKKAAKGSLTLADRLAQSMRDNESAAGSGATKASAASGTVPPLEAETTDADFMKAVRGVTPAQSPIVRYSQGEGVVRPVEAASQTSLVPDPKEEALFAKAMQGVKPVAVRGREIAGQAAAVRALPSQDPAKALRDVLEGRVQFALHHTDEYMEGFVVGVDPLVLARLRSGQYSPEKHLDLHGMNAVQAFEALTWFIRDAYQKGLRTVVIVTGRGRNSPDGVGVLRPMLQQWLCRDPFKRVVLAFCTARPSDGGPGAAYVLLRKYKKSRGKIIWDLTPSDDDFPDI